MMPYLTPTWPAPDNVKAYTTLRQSFATLPAQPPTTETQVALQQLFHLPAEPIWLQQTHSNIVLDAMAENRHQIGDASVATSPEQICIVLTADCLPILVCDRAGTQVAAVHAGWRGLASGIIERTLLKFNQARDDLLVWLGPAIGPDKFEVGKDVFDAFVSQHQASEQAFRAIKKDKWLGDLYALARLRLNLAGVHHIYGGDYCTYTQDELFFSYRRSQGQNPGRMYSLIWFSEK